MLKNRLPVFENPSTPHAVWTLAVPMIISQLIYLIYNYADTWFVGRTQNAAMVASINVSLPVFVIMAAIANLFGVGGASVISRYLGMKKEEKAKNTFAFCIFGGLFAALIYMTVIIITRPYLIYMAGGDSNDYDYIYSYMFWTMIIGAIPTVGNFLCGHLIRSTGAAREAGIGMSMGGILNIILDPLFMFVILSEGNEVMGAAIATCLSNTAAFIYFLTFIYLKKDNPVFTLNPKDISFKNNIPGEVLFIGLPAALQTFLAMISGIFANALTSGYGTKAVAGMGIAKKINMFSFHTSMGITQGVLPLIGYNFGAKKIDRLKETVSYVFKVLLALTICCNLIFYIGADFLVAIFIKDAQTVAFGASFLKIISFEATLGALCYLVNAIFQGTGKKFRSFILSVMRKGLLDIPFMFIFRNLMGVNGIVFATPFTETISFAVSAVLLLRFLKGLTDSSR